MTNTISQKLADNSSTIIDKMSTGTKARRAATIPSGLQPFTASALGNFPYYWQSQTDLSFNQKTYQWINASLKQGITPVQLGQPFTNLFIEALASISYSLSRDDTAKLNLGAQNIETCQLTLLQSWRSSYPDANNINIDNVIKTITQTWASPATALTAMRQSTDITALLNNVPASGQPVLATLIAYLDALNAIQSLQNAPIRNNGYLTSALAGVQTPSADNGGLLTTDKLIHPAYAVATPLQQILNGLGQNDKECSFEMKILLDCHAEGQCSAVVDDEQQDELKTTDILDITLNDDDADINISSEGNTISVQTVFCGVTMVYFSPVAFDKSTLLNWYWMTPIIDAIENSDKDVSGFKFSPTPDIDFSKNGPFAFLTGVAISRHPSFVITIETPNYAQLAQQIEAAQSIKLNFMNATIDAALADSNAVVTDANTGSLTLKFGQSTTVVNHTMDSTAFVLGVQTQYPATSI